MRGGAVGQVERKRPRARTSAPPTFEVTEAKLFRPPIRPGIVRRNELVERLRASDSASVVSITAPAGYGKTTLLAEWAERDRRPFAWVSLDEADGDPVVFLGHVVEIPSLLPWVMLVDVLRQPLDFRYRLIGTGIAARARHDHTGCRFSDLSRAGSDSVVWKDRMAVVQTRAPKLTAPP